MKKQFYKIQNRVIALLLTLVGIGVMQCSSENDSVLTSPDEELMKVDTVYGIQFVYFEEIKGYIKDVNDSALAEVLITSDIDSTHSDSIGYFVLETAGHYSTQLSISSDGFVPLDTVINGDVSQVDALQFTLKREKPIIE